jgi:hypothetical protein
MPSRWRWGLPGRQVKTIIKAGQGLCTSLTDDDAAADARYSMPPPPMPAGCAWCSCQWEVTHPTGKPIASWQRQCARCPYWPAQHIRCTNAPCHCWDIRAASSSQQAHVPCQLPSSSSSSSSCACTCEACLPIVCCSIATIPACVPAATTAGSHKQLPWLPSSPARQYFRVWQFSWRGIWSGWGREQRGRCGASKDDEAGCRAGASVSSSQGRS